MLGYSPAPRRQRLFANEMSATKPSGHFRTTIHTSLVIFLTMYPNPTTLLLTDKAAGIASKFFKI